MKKGRDINIFLDANVFLDYLIYRGKHASNLQIVFKKAKSKFVNLYVSSLSFAIVYHHMRQKRDMPHRIAINLLTNTYPKVKCITVDSPIIWQAMISGFDDYEDAVQYGCVLKIPKCKAIVTEDKKGFLLSKIPVIDTQTFWNQYFKPKNERHGYKRSNF